MKEIKFKKIAKEVINEEIKSLQKLKSSIDKNEHNIESVFTRDLLSSFKPSNRSVSIDLITKVIKGKTGFTKANQHHHTAQSVQSLPRNYCKSIPTFLKHYLLIQPAHFHHPF